MRPAPEPEATALGAFLAMKNTTLTGSTNTPPVVSTEVFDKWEVVANDDIATQLSAPCNTPDEAIESFRDLWRRGMCELWDKPASEIVAGVRPAKIIVTTTRLYGEPITIPDLPGS